MQVRSNAIGVPALGLVHLISLKRKANAQTQKGP